MLSRGWAQVSLHFLQTVRLCFCVLYFSFLADAAVEVIDLTDDTFEKQTKATAGANGNWYVHFYYEGCEKCEEVAEFWEEVAQELVGHAQVARVEAVENPGLRERFGIEDMPVIILFTEGKMVKYVHPLKTKDIIVKYAQTGFKSMIDSKRLCSIEPDLGGAKGDDNCPLIESAVNDVPRPKGSQKSKEQPASEAKKSKSEAKKSKGESKRSQVEKKRSQAAKAQVFELTDKNFEQQTQALKGSNGNWYVHFYYDGCAACEEVSQHWQEVAQELVGHANVARVEAVDNAGLRDRFELEDFPEIIMFSEGKMIKYIHPIKTKKVLISYGKTGFKEVLNSARLCSIEPDSGGTKGDDSCETLAETVRDVPKLETGGDEL